MPTCRACREPLELVFADLGEQPLSNSYLDSPDDPDPRYPLVARLCHRCLLVQADEVVHPDEIFAPGYAFVSGASAPWRDHCRAYVAKMMGRFCPGSVLEIASNDGTLLTQFPGRVRTLGVDPAGIPAPVETIHKFFTSSLADQLDPADLVIANNVLGHVPDINDFLEGLRKVTRNVATIEFPWLLNLIRLGQYDTIYHEHFSYWSLVALEDALQTSGLHPFDAEELDVHGGSLRVYVSPEQRPSTRSYTNLRRRETLFGLNDPLSAAYQGFQERVVWHSTALRTFFDKPGVKVGAGAPAKGNTLLNTAGIGADAMACTTDTSPYKQGKYLPGSHIPIRTPAEVDMVRPDYLFILAWNWADAIKANFATIREWGGRFVVPIPNLEIT